MKRPIDQQIVIAWIVAGITMLPPGFTPARADFYSLDGRFQCIDRNEAVCGDAQPLVPPVRAVTPIPQPAPAAGPIAAAPLHVMPPVVAQAPELPPPPTISVDPLRAIAKRVQAGNPTGGDIAWLREMARAQNARAIELLAWCELHSVGMSGDPIEAYILYGVAASAGVPHARDNQALVYEQNLTSEQRQQLLDLTRNGLPNTSVALAQLPR
jgi:hypothetical protein